MVRNQVENKKIIAVTGGIGSGKSTVLTILKQKGYLVISSDEIVSDLYKNRSFLRSLKKLFPSAVKGFFRPVADKKIISDVVFKDEKKRLELNALIHPKVIETGFRKANESEERIAFMEVPLLFEGNFQKEFDKIIVVMRDKSARIESVKKRSNLSESEIIERINAQIDYETLDKTNYLVINNDQTEKELSSQVDNLLKTI